MKKKIVMVLGVIALTCVGFFAGIGAGKSQGIEQGTKQGIEQGYEQGYNDGYEKADSEWTVGTRVIEVADIVIEDQCTFGDGQQLTQYLELTDISIVRTNKRYDLCCKVKENTLRVKPNKDAQNGIKTMYFTDHNCGFDLGW